MQRLRRIDAVQAAPGTVSAGGRIAHCAALAGLFVACVVFGAAFADEPPVVAVAAAADEVSADADETDLTAEQIEAIERETPADAADRADSADRAEVAVAPGAELAANAELAEGDELWFVSSRRARTEPDGSVRLDYWRYDSEGCWRSRSLDDFLAADPSLPTCFYVHGNRLDLCHANISGWRWYCALTGGCCKRPPLRFVIFSWPSDRCTSVNGRKDEQIKAVRAECHAFYLAWLVDRLPTEARVSMIGYSFGGRVIGGALHLLGGGVMRGRALAERAVESRQVRAVLLAAAIDNDCFAPCGCYERAPCQFDHVLVTINCADPAMKWYPLLYQIMLRRRLGQQAMGYTGVAGLNCPCEKCGHVEHRDVTCTVGREHGWSAFEYLLPNLTERIRQYAYFEPLD